MNVINVTIKQRNNECTVTCMLVNKKKFFENRIFARIPGHFQLKISVRKPNCLNSETFVNRGLTILAWWIFSEFKASL